MILLIDTSQQTGTVALSEEGVVLFSEENKIARDHAAWLHTAIERILDQAKLTVRDIEAVAVVAGPGSYTGLRVGMAAAKGFCYALKIPLITQNTLYVMAESMKPVAQQKNALICPMIDARRNEVFTALYSFGPVTGHRSSAFAKASADKDRQPTTLEQPLTPHYAGQAANRQLLTNEQPPTAHRQPPTLTELLPPQALILDKTSFETELSKNPIIFFGSGAEKWEQISISPNAVFEPQHDVIHAFAALTQHDFLLKNWADTIYSEPVYLKEFFSY